MEDTDDLIGVLVGVAFACSLQIAVVCWWFSLWNHYWGILGIYSGGVLFSITMFANEATEWKI